MLDFRDHSRSTVDEYVRNYFEQTITFPKRHSALWTQKEEQEVLWAWALGHSSTIIARNTERTRHVIRCRLALNGFITGEGAMSSYGLDCRACARQYEQAMKLALSRLLSQERSSNFDTFKVLLCR